MKSLRPFSGSAGGYERHRQCALRQGCYCQAHAFAAQPDAQAAKDRLRELIAPVNRGIFGVKAELQRKIEAECATLEQLNTCTAPLEQIESVAGTWRVLYSSIRILGTKRSKLGLREFVKVGDLWQDIDAKNSKATNRVEFSISGFGTFKGELIIRAGFTVASAQRAEVTFESAQLQPAQLDKLFSKYLDLLLSIFNPEGWLDVTYLDDEMRVGRDDRGNLFVLERA